MKTFNQFITEGRDAPLYHGTRAYLVSRIIFEDALVGSSGMQRNMISLTRSVRTAQVWSEGSTSTGPGRIRPHDGHPISLEDTYVLELNQTLLSRNKKLIPVNMAGIWSNSREYGYSPDEVSSKYETLFEEHVKSPLMPISRYLTKIIVGNFQTLSQYGIPALSSKENATVLEHPLLYDWKTKRFINK
jgi:hypothetical protein